MSFIERIFGKSKSTAKRSGSNNIIFRGESEKSLVRKMEKHGKIDLENKDEHNSSPFGAIFVGVEYKDSWIAKREGFVGWNVIVCDLPTKMISFK